LAVNGLVEIKRLKKNSSAKAGNLLYLTKPVGTGIISTAEKRGIVRDEHIKHAIENMTLLNKAGARISALEAVSAMTDITGFGLLGHLIEMCEGSGVNADLYYDKIPLMAGLDDYLRQMCYPDNTFRNWNGYSAKVNTPEGNALFTLCDPQTNGGLLIAVEPGQRKEFEKLLMEEGLEKFIEPIGVLKEKKAEEKRVTII